MDKRLGKPKQFRLPSMGSDLWASLNETLPLLTQLLAFPEKGLVNLKLAYRGEDEILAVIKRYNDDGRVDVCFGSGSDAVAALIGLERAVNHDKWRPDRYLNKDSKG